MRSSLAVRPSLEPVPEVCRRWRDMASTTRSTSAVVFSRESEKRTAPCAEVNGTFMARSTCEGSIEPDAQAEPDEAAIPCWFRRRRMESLSRCSKAMFSVLGTLSSRSPTTDRVVDPLQQTPLETRRARPAGEACRAAATPAPVPPPSRNRRSPEHFRCPRASRAPGVRRG